MRRYLSTIHERSESHKRHFALAVSSGVTLSIFGVWALVNFGTGDAQQAAVVTATKEVSPFASLKKDVSEAVGSLTSGVQRSVDLQEGYADMKADVLNTYGQ